MRSLTQHLFHSSHKYLLSACHQLCAVPGSGHRMETAEGADLMEFTGQWGRELLLQCNSHQAHGRRQCAKLVMGACEGGSACQEAWRSFLSGTEGSIVTQELKKSGEGLEGPGEEMNASSEPRQSPELRSPLVQSPFTGWCLLSSPCVSGTRLGPERKLPHPCPATAAP